MKSALVLLLLSSSAYAARSGSELSHSLTLGEGIASPALDGALRANPVGLVYNTGTKILGHAGSNNSDFTPLDYGGHVFFGNGSVGAGAGYRRTSGVRSTVDYGFGFTVDSLNSSLGFGGATIIDDGRSSDLNIGYVYGANSPLTLAATLFGVLDKIDRIGAGVAGDLGQNATLGIDAVSSTDFGTVGFKPFLGIHLQEFQLGVSYGLGEGLARKISLGLGLRLGRSVQLSGYYNQFNEYYLGLMFRL